MLKAEMPLRSPRSDFVKSRKMERRINMKKLGRLAVCVILGSGLCLAQDLGSIIHGTIKKVDHATKTVVVKTADGTEHTVKVTDEAAVKGTKEGFDGLKEGTEVVARTTGKGVDESAVEVGKVSKDGFKATKGTVTKFDKDTKTVVVKTADGTEKTFELTDDAVKDAGKATGKGAAKGAEVTVYYTEEGGKKTAHFLAE
jgi:arginine repressor